MKYKVMLTGQNNTMINDFFTQLDESFELITTSGRYRDVSNHLKYFKPDIFVYCLYHESNKYVNSFLYVRELLEKNNIPLAIIGSEEECEEFIQYPVKEAELVLNKSRSAANVRSQIVAYLEQLSQQEEDYVENKQDLEDEEIGDVQQSMKEEMRLAEEWIEEESYEEEGESAERVKKSDGPRKHILVVDDNPMILKLIKRRLSEEYNVATARSGKIALKFLQNKATDLILLDYEMPEENGTVILEQLHQNEATKDIPVVFLTGVTEREKIQKALALKPQGYLLKPIDQDKLITTIEKCIG